MKINFLNKIEHALKVTAIVATPVICCAQTKTPPQQDTFEYQQQNTIAPQNTTTQNSTLENAPSPNVTIQGKPRKAVIVIDIAHNTLYTYDQNGKPQEAFSVATGKSSTPTHKAIKIVSHVEKYPYSTAPKTTKRRNHPNAYGKRIIITKIIDPKTGELSDNGEYIHGTNDPSSIGHQASGGCIRASANDIMYLSSIVKSGDVIVYK